MFHAKILYSPQYNNAHRALVTLLQQQHDSPEDPVVPSQNNTKPNIHPGSRPRCTCTTGGNN
eukprot:9280027-Ditylum_brightwellii.AAC.1